MGMATGTRSALQCRQRLAKPGGGVLQFIGTHATLGRYWRQTLLFPTGTQVGNLVGANGRCGTTQAVGAETPVLGCANQGQPDNETADLCKEQAKQFVTQGRFAEGYTLQIVHIQGRAIINCYAMIFCNTF